MDYEKAYKELVKNFDCVLKLKSVKENGTIPVDDVRKLIPELRESEDERIKRCIQVALTDVDEKRFNDYDTTLKDCLAWLEKQREKTNPYSGVSFTYNGHIWGMCARDNGVDILFNNKLIQHISGETQGKQKPADSYCKENCKGFQETGKCFADGECKAKIEAEQNHTWSEEDSQMLDVIVTDLKLLKNKEIGEIRKAAYQMEIDWLKSIKPQSHWKPSEEQLLSLQEAISIVGENSISGRNLIEILEQLKTL